MRQRLVNEKAVNKTLAFLKDIYLEITQGGGVKNISAYHVKHNVSKNTGTACILLNIFSKSTFDHEHYLWNVSAGKPNREIAIQVLEVLRRRNDKVVTVPLAGFEDLIAHLDELVNTLKPVNIDGGDTIHQPKGKMLHRALNQAEMGGNNLFSQSDKKHDDLLKIATGISTAVYNNWFSKFGANDDAEMEATNDFIVKASNDLLTKIYK